MADGQQEIPAPGPLALRPGDQVERPNSSAQLSPYSITMPAETGVVIDVVTGEAGHVQTVFIAAEGTTSIVVELHVTSDVHAHRNRWRKVAGR